MSRKKVVLAKTSPEEANNRASAVGKGSFIKYLRSNVDGDDVVMFKAHDDENCIRILPPTEGQNFYAISVFAHYDVGVDSASFLCRKKMKIGDGSCPVCEERAQLSSETPPDNSKELEALEASLKELKPAQRCLLQVIDRDNEDKGVLIWDAPKGLIDEILTQSRIPSRQGGGMIPIDDLDDGRDVLFRKTGKAMMTRYKGVRLDSRPSTVDDEFIDQMWYLDDILVKPSYDEVQKEFIGGGGGNDVDEKGMKQAEDDRKRQSRYNDEEEAPTRSSRKNRGESADEEEAPTRSSRKNRGESADEEETDEEIKEEIKSRKSKESSERVSRRRR